MTTLPLAILLGGALLVSPQKPAPEGGDKIISEPVTLTGCVGEGEGTDTFVLSNVQRADIPVGTSGGTTGVPANVVYWLDSPKRLRSHIGHRVEIQGTLEEDVDSATVKRDGDTVNITTERTKAVEIPVETRAAAEALTGPARRITYKVKVASVRTISTGCRK